MRRATNDPIPAERVALEHKLIRALDMGPEQIADALASFDWEAGNRELACLGLAELARRQSVGGARAVALKVSAYCGRACGAYCARCPVAAARAA